MRSPSLHLTPASASTPLSPESRAEGLAKAFAFPEDRRPGAETALAENEAALR